MYPWQANGTKTLAEAQEKHFKSLDAIGNSAGASIPQDLSVIEQQLQRNAGLNTELADSVSGLISHIRKVIRHDPREMTSPVGSGQIKAGPSCELEAQMMALNDALEQQVFLLRQVRGALCL